MEKPCMRITLDGVQENEWFKLNPGSIDFYRVFYSDEMIAQLEPYIKDLNLPPADRANVLSDVFAVCRSGRSPITQVLNRTETILQIYIHMHKHYFDQI